MADLAQHSSYNAEYSGLLNNFYLTLAIAGVCLVGYEIEIHIPRRRGREGKSRRLPVRIGQAITTKWKDRRKGATSQAISRDEKAVSGLGELDGAKKKLGDRESWEFGYIYQPRAWALRPSPPVPRLPLAWIGSALKVSEHDMPSHCGLDLTLHMRFIRGSFFYTLLQCLVVLPILMPLHVIYSPDTVASTSMLKASITSLVESDGNRWLWVHAVLIWWVSITWTMTALWIAWGALAYRRRELVRLKDKSAAARKSKNVERGGEDGLRIEGDEWSIKDDSDGIKRFRTLMITNVPPDMRDEQTLREYFDFYLTRHRNRSSSNSPGNGEDSAIRSSTGPNEPIMPKKPQNVIKRHMRQKNDEEVDVQQRDGTEGALSAGGILGGTGSGESDVDEVVLVRKLSSLLSLRSRRHDVLKELEIAHVKLAKRVLQAVERHKSRHPTHARGKVILQPVHDAEKGLRELNAGRNEMVPSTLDRHARLDQLVEALGNYVDDAPQQRGEGDESVWDILHALPRELLDPYQALTHMPITSIFRNQNAPLIDYLTTKLAYLTSLLNEARSKPLSSYSASSTAFVTFKDARTARLALKILSSHPRRSLACHTASAPEWTDLLWPRLGRSVYRSEFVRGWVVTLGVWVFTLAWIFPVSIFCAIASLSNIAGFIKPLETWLAANPRASSAITSLAPVILVALLTLAICPILLLIANKAETIVTKLGIHNSVMSRFWKFLMVNGVIFFAIGQTAIEAYLTAFQSNNFDPLPIISSAFPTAAPYFASYILLQVAIQPFFEIFRFGLPAIVYVFGTRVSTIPRQRNSRTEFPTFSHFSQVPLQLLAGAIMHLFMLLNPLVIPFTLVFYGALYVVWKRQFTYVYGRLYETNGRRSSVRILRYSMDALALGQFVLFAFFILQKVKGHAIATGILFFVTLVAKLVITRALKRRFDKLDMEEADTLCPPLGQDDETMVYNGSDEFDPARDSEDLREGDVRNQAPETWRGKRDDTSSTHFGTMRRSIGQWAGKWGFDSIGSNRHDKDNSDRPIPFDHTFFSSLDRKISFDPDAGHASEKSDSPKVPTETFDTELQHQPDQGIHHPPDTKVITAHHPLRPWEDIPPYQRARGYNDQPAYTDDFDDFLWLPRDPLSTLDLDDTVEMRLSLTTSTGGSGQIGDWPVAKFGGEETETNGEDLLEEEQDYCDDGGAVENHPNSPEARSERPLLDVEIPPHIGSEVDDHESRMGSVRRGTQRAALGFSRLFRRPRASTTTSMDGISLTSLNNGRIESSGPADHQSEVSPSSVVHQSPTSESSVGHSMVLPGLVTASPPPMPRTGSGQTNISWIPSLAEPSPNAQPITPRRTGSQLSVPLNRANTQSPSAQMNRITSSSSALQRTPNSARPYSSGSAMRSTISRSSQRSRGGSNPVQQALLDEVKAEEERANAERRKEESKDVDIEAKELEKERARVETRSMRSSSLGRSRSRGGVMLGKEEGAYKTRRDSHVGRS